MFIVVESSRTLLGGQHPETSWIGIGLAAFTAIDDAAPSRSPSAASGASSAQPRPSPKRHQNQICAYLSIALFVGLLANALAGWWWADPAAALVIAGVAAYEGIESWRGERCECC